MRRMMIVLVALLLAVSFATAMAEEKVALGKSFPDFTATDTEGNVFTLSEALKDHEVALINVWASWCGPCRAEMPYLNEAFEQYGDRVAFIALSCEDEDTMEIIDAYRQDLGLRFPMGRDEGASLLQFLGASGIPSTVVVDRFGNAVFTHVGSFFSAGEITRVLDAFLGDGYTETRPLTEIPRDTSTRAFPVSAERAIQVENENAQRVLLRTPDEPEPEVLYVVGDDVAHLRLELTPSDDPAAVVYYTLSDFHAIEALLDAERNAYVIDQPMPKGASESYYVYSALMDMNSDEPFLYGVYLVQSEDELDALVEEMASWGYEVTVEDDDSATEVQAQSYVLHVVDQDGEPVPGVVVNFCTDTACTTLEADEAGTISYEGAPENYHIQVIKVPEGYSFDPNYALSTDGAYGEWLLRVCREAGEK